MELLPVRSAGDGSAEIILGEVRVMRLRFIADAAGGITGVEFSRGYGPAVISRRTGE